MHEKIPNRCLLATCWRPVILHLCDMRQNESLSSLKSPMTYSQSKLLSHPVQKKSPSDSCTQSICFSSPPSHVMPSHSLGATAQLKELLRGEHLLHLPSAPAPVAPQHQTTRSQPRGSFQNLLTRHSARGEVPLTHLPLIYCLLTFQQSVNGCFFQTQVHLHLLRFEHCIVFTRRSCLFFPNSPMFRGFPT